MTSTISDWRAIPADNAIGDPGRQAEIKAVAGPLDVGVPDTALDFLSLESLELRGCSTRGWSHRYQGTPRQDCHAVLVTDDLLVIAVADGVSEGTYSQVAAETAARSACKVVAHDMARNGEVDWVQLARRVSMRIIDEAEYRQLSTAGADDHSLDERLEACLRVMATTLIVAVVHTRAEAAGLPAEIAVVAGDSAAYVLPADGTHLVPAGGGKTAEGPISSTRVRPLPGPAEPECLRLHLRPGDMLALGTDGLGDPVGDGDGDVGHTLAQRWRTPPTVESFLLDLNFYRRSYDDDRTCVAVWVRPDVELPEEVAVPVAEVAQVAVDAVDDPADAVVPSSADGAAAGPDGPLGSPPSEPSELPNARAAGRPLPPPQPDWGRTTHSDTADNTNTNTDTDTDIDRKD